MARSVVVCWGTGDYPYSPADARGESGAQLGGCWAKDLLVAKRLNQDQRRDSFTFDPSLASKRIYNGIVLLYQGYLTSITRLSSSINFARNRTDKQIILNHRRRYKGGGADCKRYSKVPARENTVGYPRNIS